MAEFKVNIYPLMYWGLAYGLIAGFVLFVLFLLSKYITVIWFPVFLAGLIWGGYRNYKKQKDGWSKQSNEPKKSQSPADEVKEAVKDIFSATKEMVAEQLEPVEGSVEEAPEVLPEGGVESAVPPQVERPSTETGQTETQNPEAPEAPKPPL
jgi:hypothetical protein